MTYEQALSFVERIEDIVIGAPLDGRVIQSLTIGPTDWEQMSDFLNLRIQKGEETALIESLYHQVVHQRQCLQCVQQKKGLVRRS